MWYVYCLENSDRNYLYIGSTNNLKRRLYEHNNGLCKSTKSYMPFSISTYIALTTEYKARSLEKYFKTGSGKIILKKRILQSEVPKMA